jgi:hypothetical protein
MLSRRNFLGFGAAATATAALTSCSSGNIVSEVRPEDKQAMREVVSRIIQDSNANRSYILQDFDIEILSKHLNKTIEVNGVTFKEGAVIQAQTPVKIPDVIGNAQISIKETRFGIVASVEGYKLDYSGLFPILSNIGTAREKGIELKPYQIYSFPMPKQKLQGPQSLATSAPEPSN